MTALMVLDWINPKSLRSGSEGCKANSTDSRKTSAIEHRRARRGVEEQALQIEPPAAAGPEFLDIGAGAGARRIAFLRRAAAAPCDRAGLVWLGGFRSNMRGEKAVPSRSRGCGGGPRLPAFRLFGTWRIGGPLRGRDDRHVAGGKPCGVPRPDGRPADSGRIFDGRLACAARRAGARRRRRGGRLPGLC